MSLQPELLAEDAFVATRPVLVELARGFGPHGGALWLGNQLAAEDAAMLEAAGVTTSLNVAVNIDPAGVIFPDGLVLRRAKVGLIDGPGNPTGMLAAAVGALDAAFALPSPEKRTYPRHRPGGVLVHCRGGRSRSVTVAALFLHARLTERFPRFEDALAHVRNLRGLAADEADAPRPEMVALARALLAKAASPADLLS